MASVRAPTATVALLEPSQAKQAAAAAAMPASSSQAIAEAATADAEAAADTPDEPVIDEEVKAESAELEQVRAAEEKAQLSEQPVVEDPAARAAARLGLESPLRQRLRDAFGRESGGPLESIGRIAGLPEIDHDLRHLQAEYDIPIEVNERVLAYVRFFQAPTVRKHFVKYLGRASKYVPVFRRVLRDEGLPEDTVYLAMIESGFANLATSRAKAVGAWQFIPATGKRFGMKQDFWVDERRDPEKAARGAARYLKELYRQTGDWRLAWAGHNAGVGKNLQGAREGPAGLLVDDARQGPEGGEKGYVPKLMAAAIIAKHHEAFGFPKAEIEARPGRSTTRSRSRTRRRSPPSPRLPRFRRRRSWSSTPSCAAPAPRPAPSSSRSRRARTRRSRATGRASPTRSASWPSRSTRSRAASRCAPSLAASRWTRSRSPG